jgi:hypothetical protein
VDEVPAPPYRTSIATTSRTVAQMLAVAKGR